MAANSANPVAMSESLTLRQPDDWHLHVRSGAVMRAVLADTAAVFGRAVIMPNLTPPVTTAALAAQYRAQVQAALPSGSGFMPLMALYLTDETDPADLVAGFEAGEIVAAKLYPAGATTNSDAGVTDIRRLDAVLEAMEKTGVPLLIHGEVTDPAIDIFDREVVFIERILAPLLGRHPGLKIVLEHMTTKEAVDFVRAAPANVAATITAHHLMINRNAIFAGGVRPHMYCLPIAKREVHRLALVEAATSGEAKFFLGTDSAPHMKHLKEAECGCAGIYTAAVAMPCYAEVFEGAGKLENLERFASLNGPAFYGLPPNEKHITLVKSPNPAPTQLEVAGEGTIQHFRAGETLAWQVT